MVGAGGPDGAPGAEVAPEGGVALFFFRGGWATRAVAASAQAVRATNGRSEAKVGWVGIGTKVNGRRRARGNGEFQRRTEIRAL